ncbi:MAG: hypothetical protein ACXWP5_12025, partial [Bdellovibrionota bacterium]
MKQFFEKLNFGRWMFVTLGIALALAVSVTLVRAAMAMASENVPAIEQDPRARTQLQELERELHLACSARIPEPRAWVVETVLSNAQAKLQSIGERVALVRAYLAGPTQIHVPQLDAKIRDLQTQLLISRMRGAAPEELARLETGIAEARKFEAGAEALRELSGKGEKAAGRELSTLEEISRK